MANADRSNTKFRILLLDKCSTLCNMKTLLARFVFVAAFASLLHGCGGGGGSSEPPVPMWSSAQIAPLKTITSRSGIYSRVYSDGSDGVFVVGEEDDGIVIQRFSATGGWQASALALRGLASIQTVAIEGGLAIFWRDERYWFRRDLTAAGLQSVQTQFPVRLSASVPIEVQFSRTYDGAILAANSVAGVAVAAAGGTIETQEFRQNAWSKIEAFTLSAPDGAQGNFLGGSADVVRSKVGDVTIGGFSLLYPYTYVALRRPGETVFTPVTTAVCIGGRCGAANGRYRFLTLQQDGRATVLRDPVGGPPTQWLLVDRNPPIELWPAGVDATGVTPYADTIMRLAPDGTPLWLSNVGSQLAIWEKTTKSAWQAAVGEAAACDTARCAVFSRPDSKYLATLHNDNATTMTLNVSERVASGQWANTATINASALLSIPNYFGPFALSAFHATPTTQIVVGFVEAPPTNSLPPLPVANKAYVAFAFARK